MPTLSETAATPRYLLLEGNTPIGPALIPEQSENCCLTVYGFSAKGAYDRFLANSERELRPYPLVKRYLQQQSAEHDSQLMLVVLDANSPRQQSIMAVTMESAFAAQSDNAAHIGVEYHLDFDSQSGAYRLPESVT